MTQVAGQRGIQPPHYAFQSTSHKALPVPKGKQPNGAASGGVKFGGTADRFVNAGLSGLAKVVPVSIFEKITEVFLVGFIAQDAIAMWLPRVGTSLKVGREPYEPQNDPQAKNLPFHEQIKKWVVGNYKGLNWVNFNEETKREFATGPGLLSVPAAMFVLNRYLGNHAREMSFQSLRDLGTGFSEHMASVQKGEKLTEEAYRAHVKEYIQRLFVDPKFGESERAFLREWSQKWTDNLFEQEKQPRGKRWLESTKRFFSKSGQTPLEVEAGELAKKVRAFNRITPERMLPYSELSGVIADSAPLHQGGQTWVSYRPAAFERVKPALERGNPTQAVIEEAKGLVGHASADHLTADLTRFGGYVKAVFDNYSKSKGNAAISEVAEATMKKLAGSKMIFGVGTTALTAIYLLKLAFWAQNHDSYQAVRLLKHDHASGKGTHPMQQGQQPSLTGMPMQAGLPFGAQPASVYLGMRPSSFRAPAPPPMMNPFAPRSFAGNPMMFRAANNQQPGWRNA